MTLGDSPVKDPRRATSARSWRGLRPDRSPGEARRQPVPTAAAPVEQVEGALETSDGRWQVEVVRRDGHLSYRLLHADNMVEGPDLAGVQRLLAENGIDLADLV